MFWKTSASTFIEQENQDFIEKKTKQNAVVDNCYMVRCCKTVYEESLLLVTW